MSRNLTHAHCPVCGPQTFVVRGLSLTMHIIFFLITGGIWLVVWILMELFKGQPYCAACGQTQKQAAAIARQQSSRYTREISEFERKFERIQEIIENLPEEEIATLEAKGIEWQSKDRHFDFDPPANSSALEMEHYMEKVRLEVEAMLDRLELVLGYRPG